MDDVKERLRQFIVSNYLPGESVANLKDDTPLQTSGVLDSLATLGLVTFVEKEFGIAVADEDLDLDNFRSINAISGLIARKKAA